MSTVTDPMMMDDEELTAYRNSGQMSADMTEMADSEIDTVETPIEIEEDTVEQPVTDSVEDTTAEEEVNETEVKEEPEETTEVVAGQEEVVEDENSEVTEVEETKSEDDVLNTYLNTTSKVRANKADIEFTNREKIAQFDKMYSQAANYTKKTQKLSKFGKRISAMEEADMTDDQFNMMIDVLKGDKDAITSVIKGAGLDALDIDTEQELNYTPNNYGKSNVELEVDEAYAEIDSDTQGTVTRNVISNQWDDRSRQQIVDGVTLPNGKKLSTKDMMTGLHSDVVDGTYEIVNSMATKLKIQDGGSKSDMDYYLQAGGEYSQQLASQEYTRQESAKVETERVRKVAAEAKVIADVKAKQAKTDQAKIEDQKRKDAAVTKTNAGASNTVDYLDVENMTDDEFQAMYSKQKRI